MWWLIIRPMPVLISVLIGCILGCLATSQSDGWGGGHGPPGSYAYVIAWNSASYVNDLVCNCNFISGTVTVNDQMVTQMIDMLSASTQIMPISYASWGGGGGGGGRGHGPPGPPGSYAYELWHCNTSCYQWNHIHYQLDHTNVNHAHSHHTIS